MSLERFCRKPVATALAAQTVREAADKMRERHVGALIVIEQDRPIGMLTDRDIVCRVVANGRDPSAVTVETTMTGEVATIRTDQAIEEAAFLMRQKGVRRLPIVDHEGNLRWVVSLDDLHVLLAAELMQTAEAVRVNKGP